FANLKHDMSWRDSAGWCAVCSANKLGLGLVLGNRNVVAHANRKPQPKVGKMLDQQLHAVGPN
ncbi:MAG: hypothetical protein ACKPKO_33005, partial [Candidatus Fonsibacter sp.]